MMAGGAPESEISAINKPAGGWSPARPMDWGSRFVLVLTMLAGLFMTAAGVAALLAPSWFARRRRVPPTHSLRPRHRRLPARHRGHGAAGAGLARRARLGAGRPPSGQHPP